MARDIISFAVFFAVIAAVWYFFRKKRDDRRRAQASVLESMGFSVQREGISGDPRSRRDISSASGHVRGYELRVKVAADVESDMSNQTNWYNPYTTISTTLRYTLSDIRITNRRWSYGDPLRRPPRPEDGGEVTIGAPGFDEHYFLFCQDGAAVRYWLTVRGADRFDAIAEAKDYVQIPDKRGNGILVRGNELSLRVSAKSAEKLDLKSVMDFFVTVARLFDELGARAAER